VAVLMQNKQLRAKELASMYVYVMWCMKIKLVNFWLISLQWIVFNFLKMDLDMSPVLMMPTLPLYALKKLTLLILFMSDQNWWPY
jgi:hypothetical protein